MNTKKQAEKTNTRPVQVKLVDKRGGGAGDGPAMNPQDLASAETSRIAKMRPILQLVNVETFLVENVTSNRPEGPKRAAGMLSDMGRGTPDKPHFDALPELVKDSPGHWTYHAVMADLQQTSPTHAPVSKAHEMAEVIVERLVGHKARPKGGKTTKKTVKEAKLSGSPGPKVDLTKRTTSKKRVVAKEGTFAAKKASHSAAKATPAAARVKLVWLLSDYSFSPA